MQIYIVGNGVIAKALAVALSLAGRSVTIIRGSTDDQPATTSRLHVEVAGQLLEAGIPVQALLAHTTLQGIVLLTNKSFGNEALAGKLLSKIGTSPVVLLQNGLNIEEAFIHAGYQQVYRCVLMATSQSVSENKVMFKPVAPSPVGVISGKKDMLQEIIDQIHTDVFPFRKEDDIQPFIWKKVISNCVFNSICPLLETDNGIFQRNEEVLAMAKTVIAECVAVAQQYNIPLTEAAVLENVLSISKMADGQKISTYQDILNKRETEIMTLNYAVAHAARQAGNIPTPVTAMLGQLVKMKSDLSRS